MLTEKFQSPFGHTHTIGWQPKFFGCLGGKEGHEVIFSKMIAQAHPFSCHSMVGVCWMVIEIFLATKKGGRHM
jgi:hypothetical protein